MKLKTLLSAFLLFFIFLVGPVIAQSQNSVEGDRQALVDLYNATDGDNWKNNSGWLSGNPSDSWHGVEVNGSGRVVRLNLRNNNLSGTLPESIGNLTKVTYFNVKQNSLTGKLPWSGIGNMTSLTYLLLNGQVEDPDPASNAVHPGKDLSGHKSQNRTNDFTGSMGPEVGNLVNLRHLELMGVNSEHTGLTGPIPSDIGNLTKLEGLYLGFNSFESLPSSMGSLTNLLQFGMNNNGFTGLLPSWIANWTKLKYLWFEDNNFTGDVPDLSALTDLRTFIAKRNNFDGQIPGWLFDGTMPNINLVDLGFNEFTGSLPEFGTPNNLYALQVDFNNLSGTIPASISNLTKMTNFGLGWNNFEGEIPDLSHMHQLRYIRANDNDFTGTLPMVDTSNEALKNLHFENNRMSGEIPIELATVGGLPKFESIDIRNNAFSESDYEDINAELGSKLQIGDQDPSKADDSEDPPSAPSLNSPQDGATGVALSPTLDWNGVSGADDYRVQIAPSSDFSAPVTDASGLTASQFEANGLDYGSTYYWRVRASNQYGTSGWSSVRDFRTGDEPPEKAVLVSPANGATEVSTSLSLDWNTANRAESYEVLVATDSEFTALVVDTANISSATVLEVDDLDNSTNYWWKVIAVNSGGSTESDVWSFATVEPALSRPQLAEPADGATEQPTTLTLSWNTVDGADSYRVQVATDDTYQSLFSNETGITGTSFTVENLEHGRTYYWRVRAANTEGNSNWSEARSFTTEFQVPASPSLSSPNDGATDRSTTLTLNWEQSGQVEDYQLQLATDQSFGSTFYDQAGIADTFQEVSGLGNSTTYYWRVRASNQAGTSGWSETWSFTTAADGGTTVLPAPVQVSPNDGASNRSLTPTFEWEPVDGADYYILHSNRLDPSEMVIDVQVNGTTYTPAEDFDPETRHHWRVRAVADGVEGEWSPIREFTTGNGDTADPPAAPALTSPSEGATEISTSPTFEWEAASGADTYILEVTNNNTSEVVVETEVGGTSFTTREDLDPETLYSWRVRGVNSDGVEGEWSSEWEFTTGTGEQIDTSLGQNYPNPFNPSTQVRFSLSEAQQVSLKVYDTTGRLVAILVEGRLEAGQYERTFQADNLASGVYFLRLLTENNVVTGQMTLIK